MKMLLGWAVLAVLVVVVVSAATAGLGQDGADLCGALIAGSVAVGITFFPLGYGFRALLGYTAVVAVAMIPYSILAVVLAIVLTAFAAFDVARTLRIGLRGFGLASIAYLIEGAGMYATLKLGLWQPAAVAAFILGLWWLAVTLAEKKLRLASV